MDNTQKAFHFIENDPFQKLFSKSSDETSKNHRLVILGVIILLAYVPVFLLSLYEGTLLSNTAIPLLKDFGAHFRFLAAVPILVLSRPVIQRATTQTCKYIYDVLLDTEENEDVFLPAIKKIRDLNNSWVLNAVLISVVVVFAVLLYYLSTHNATLVSVSGWFGKMENGEFHASNAYLWCSVISMSIFRFLLLRWLWTYCTWLWLLRIVARCSLKLTPHHGDKACGLNMLVFPQTRFNLFFVSMAITSSGAFINGVLYRGVVFENILQDILILFGCSFIMLLGPYMLFMPKLFQAQIASQIDMSRKSHQLSEEYDKEWIHTDATGVDDEKPDPSVMIDFYSTYEITEKIRPLPFNVRDLIALAIPIALAFLPTLLTRMSLKELIATVMRFIV